MGASPPVSRRPAPAVVLAPLPATTPIAVPPWPLCSPPTPPAEPPTLLDPPKLDPLAASEPPTLFAPPTWFAPPALLAPPLLLAPPVLLAPPMLLAPPILLPPAPPEPPVPVEGPVARKVVTLEASRVTESAPFAAATMPSLARLLAEDVVYFAYEAMLEPLTVSASDFDDVLVLTMMITTSVSLL